MLWSFLAWKVFKLSILVSFAFSLAFMLFQFLRIDKMILSLPLSETLPFLVLWISYSLFYFMPTSMLISSSVIFFELKESKRLHIIESFGVSAYRAYSKVLVRFIPVFVSFLVASFMLCEEDISFVRRYLTYKYYVSVFYSMPEKTFSTFGDVTFYVDKRKDNYLSDVFFKKDDSLVMAKDAKLSDNSIIFINGSVLVKEGDKFYLTAFSKYTINLEKFVNVERKKDNVRRDRMLNFINASLSPMLMTLGFLISRIRLDSPTKLYYLVGIVSILYQFFLVILKSAL